MNKNIAYFVVVILVAGAGYWYFSQDRSATPETPKLTTTQAVTTPETQKPATGSEPASTTPATTPESSAITDEQLKQLPAVDDTWKTYASKQNDFSFKWPTRGRYAPTWDVKFADNDCDGAADGNSKTTMTVGAHAFCHVSWKDAAAGTAYLKDAFTTKVGTRYIVISFEKKAYSSGALNCGFANEYPFSTSAQTCIQFEEPIYYAHLDQIVGTFKITD